MSASHALGTLAPIVLLCLAFLRGGRVRAPWKIGRRTLVSVAGGAAVAYVFIDLFPQLAFAAGAFRDATSHLGIRVLHVGVYLASLIAFLFFYGVEELVIRSRDEADRERRREATGVHPLFRIHMAAFSVYAWLVGYLLVRSTERAAAPLAFFTAAMALHFLSVAHALREEHGRRYDRLGAWVLAASCAAGWACGVGFGVPGTTMGILLGGVAGGVVANTVISELPREKQGEFVPFLAGAAVYTGLLVAAE
jgi:hypothetical protein